jgi:mannose-1-phosphate guanylyltransferase
MKAFILAAGHGTRLSPLTERTPKCLLPIRGTPLLEIWLENCGMAGVTDVLVNVHAHAGPMRDFVRHQSSGVRVQLAEEKLLLGSAGTLAQNRSFVAGEQEFLIVYGDVLTKMNLRALLDFHRQGAAATTLAAYEVPDPSRCGIMTVDERGNVRSFREKPERPESNLAFAGILAAGQEIFDYIPAERPADIGTHVLPRLLGRMRAIKIQEYLIDIGTKENYFAAQSSWPGLTPVEQSRARNAT